LDKVNDDCFMEKVDAREEQRSIEDYPSSHQFNKRHIQKKASVVM